MFQKNTKIISPTEYKIVDQIRSLGLDMIDTAKSGHPGIVLGAAPIIYTLYAKHLRFNPSDPNWVNRDRFVLSAGHGSALLYATLFLSGYDLSLEDLKKFRSFGSKTPGHPEYKVTPGVDMSTGPLGQGFASAVGMAIAEKYLRNYYNKDIINHYTYVLSGDGDLMEGISYEAASLAGVLKLNRLIVLYDSNHICLDGETKKVFLDQIDERFSSIGWNVLHVSDGDDLLAIDRAIEKAKEEENRPTLIEIQTTIGKFSKYQGTSKVHGAPLDEEDLRQVKERLEVREIPFTVSNEALTEFQSMINERNTPYYAEWQKNYETLPPSIKEELEKMKNGDLSLRVNDITYQIPEDRKEATRVTSGKILNSIAENTPFLIGGSADLSSSTKTYLQNLDDFDSNHPLGRNIWYGVREHAMGAISNGIALSGLRPFASTFLVFSDYLKPAIRMSALMNLGVIYIFSHDSISVGEDGPTHQPVEQLISLRSIPNMEVYRPADVNEVLGTYKAILAKKEGPSAIILGRNTVPVQESTSVNEVSNGAYIVRMEEKQLQGIIIATGEELDIALKAANILKEQGIDLRVVSMPCIERFKKQSEKYQKDLLPIGIKTFVIEASSAYSWYPFVYNENYLITINQFGASGKKEDVLKQYQMNVESAVEKIKKLFE